MIESCLAIASLTLYLFIHHVKDVLIEVMMLWRVLCSASCSYVIEGCVAIRVKKG